jgi:hypothetical protein
VGMQCHAPLFQRNLLSASSTLKMETADDHCVDIVCRILGSVSSGYEELCLWDIRLCKLTVVSHFMGVTNRRGLDWIIGFIDHSLKALIITINYNNSQYVTA